MLYLNTDHLVKKALKAFGHGGKKLEATQGKQADV